MCVVDLCIYRVCRGYAGMYRVVYVWSSYGAMVQGHFV